MNPKAKIIKKENYLLIKKLGNGHKVELQEIKTDKKMTNACYNNFYF